MKYVFLFLLTVLSILNGQEKDLLRYFPFSKGNMWQYQHNKWGNVNLFHVIDSNKINIDSSEVIVYMRSISTSPPQPPIIITHSYLIDVYAQIYNRSYSPYAPFIDLIAPPDTSWIWGDGKITVGQPFSDSILGTSMLIRPFVYTDVGGIITHHINYVAKDFGIVAIAAELGNYWKLSGCIIDNKTYGTITSVMTNGNVAEDFELNQNYPNPFNPSTTIPFTLPASVHVELNVYDVYGRFIRTLADRHFERGSHAVEFSSNGIASGTYFYRFKAGSTSIVKRMILVK